MAKNLINNGQMRRIYAMLKTLGATDEKAVLVPQFCDNRTIHLSELTTDEADEMISVLDAQLKLSSELTKALNCTIDATQNTPSVEAAKQPEKPAKRAVNNDEKAVKMRRKILHVLGNLGFTKDGKFDYERIENLIQNIGANNPEKVKFNYLNNDELVKITSQIDQIYKKRLRK
jgi:hypothetical protein